MAKVMKRVGKGAEAVRVVVVEAMGVSKMSRMIGGGEVSRGMVTAEADGRMVVEAGGTKTVEVD